MLPRNDIPTGPTANLNGLKAVDVNTDDVSDDRADDISGEVPDPGGIIPNVENIDGGPGLGPGELVAGGNTVVFGVRSRAPKEFDSDGEGLPAGGG